MQKIKFCLNFLLLFILYSEIALAVRHPNTCVTARDSLLGLMELGSLSLPADKFQVKVQECSLFRKVPEVLIQDPASNRTLQMGEWTEQGFVGCESRSQSTPYWRVAMTGVAPSDSTNAINLFSNLMRALNIAQISDRSLLFTIADPFEGTCNLQQFQTKVCHFGRKSHCIPLLIGAEECKQVGFAYQSISDAKFEAIDSVRKSERGADVQNVHSNLALSVLGPAVVNFLYKTGVKSDKVAPYIAGDLTKVGLATSAEESLLKTAFAFTVDEKGAFHFVNGKLKSKLTKAEILQANFLTPDLKKALVESDWDSENEAEVFRAVLQLHFARLLITGSVCERFDRFLEK